MGLKDKFLLAAAKLLGLMAQDQEHHNPVKTVTPGMPELLREAAASGAVLLEKDFSDIYDSEISNVLVATKNGEVVGYVSFTVIIDECQIINFATKRQYYRQGVGKAVMSALIDYAKSHGVLKVFLEVRESNEPAIALYESYGFVPVGISKNHFTSPRENAILMNLEF